MATLLLELFSEEIPSRMQRAAAEQLQRLVLEGFKKHSLAPAGVKTFVSPRHLAIQVFDLPTLQPDAHEERRGPKIGAPEQALKGFLQATGLTIGQCEQRDGYYYATIHRKGRAVADVVKEVCETALEDFSWPKSMRWGGYDTQRACASDDEKRGHERYGSPERRWVRPLHSIACLLDSEIVAFNFHNLQSSSITFGHRFLAPQALVITHAESYEQQLLAAKVMVDFAARKETIRTGVAAVAAHEKLSVIDDEELLNEVTGLVEWPVPLLGMFEEKFLQLPPEVLISEMKTHQRYFALNDTGGKLTNRFITVANMVNADGGKKVIEGNSRVVRARLSDGEFYWEQDKKTNLADWGKKLADVVFHAKVGMMDAKVARIETLALEIATIVGSPISPTSFLNDVRHAAQLCKADLTSGMVGEFPELQGIMGRYYALAQGESADVADAIRDHYKPVGANDSVPESPLAAIIAVADKLDSIISLFAAGEKPTGSKDPLALRRAALGVLRILLTHEWDLDIAALASDRKIQGEIALFFRDRVQVMLREEMIRHDIIDAALNRPTSQFSPVTLFAQARALNQWLASPAGTAAFAAIKRSMNILAAEEKKAKTTYTFDAAKCAALTLPEEVALVAALAEAQKNTAAGPACLSACATPINAFFNAVLVTEEQFRDARLGLLAGVRDAANTIADFSKIEG